jgi:putative transposase
MTALCEEFGISRKTGYKIFQRYQQIGVRGLSDRSRRPYRHANQLPLAVETLIVRLTKDRPTWGAPKLRERLRQRWPDLACPPSARFTRYSIAMVWSRTGGAAGGRGSPARRSRR